MYKWEGSFGQHFNWFALTTEAWERSRGLRTACRLVLDTRLSLVRPVVCMPVRLRLPPCPWNLKWCSKETFVRKLNNKKITKEMFFFFFFFRGWGLEGTKATIPRETGWQKKWNMDPIESSLIFNADPDPSPDCWFWTCMLCSDFKKMCIHPNCSS